MRKAFAALLFIKRKAGSELRDAKLCHYAA
jgi:hypothetical protein